MDIKAPSDYVHSEWYYHESDKTIHAQSHSESEYKITYRGDGDSKFRVIFKPKHYPIGFHHKW